MQPSSALLHQDERILILRLALPSMAASLASSLCALLDSLLLGRANTQLSAAVSVSLPVLTLIQTIGFTLGTGAGSFVSRSLGAGSRAPALRAASTAFFCALVLSFVLCTAGFFFASPLCALFGAAGAVLAPACLYMRFLLASGPLLCMNLVLSSLLRAAGRTSANLLAYCAGAAAGVLLQFLLIVRFRLGVAGSGIAMLAREGVTLIILFLCFFLRERRLLPKPGLFAPSRSVFANIMRSGFPVLLRQSLMSVSSAMLSRISASFGDAVLSGMGVCVRVMSLIASAVIGFGQGFQPVCGFAWGAGDLARVRRAYRFSMRCVIFALAAAGAVLFRFAGALLAPFSPPAEAAAYAEKALRVQSVLLFAQGAVIMMNMLTQSAGMTVRASVIASSRQGFVLIALLLVLPRLWGANGLLLCQSVSDLLSLVLCYLLSRSCLKQEPSSVIRSSCARCGCSDARTASQ